MTRSTRAGLAGLVGGWRHEDGTACPTHLNQPGETTDLWCTGHQKYIAADRPARPGPEWTVRCADGSWCADGKNGRHAKEVAGLFDACYDAPALGCGPHTAHRPDPAAALVPVPQVAEAAVLPDPLADPAGYVLAVAELREKRAKEAHPGPWCPTWTHAAIRHVQRNVEIDCEEHNPDGGVVGEDCRRFGRYDGEHIAAEANPAHALAEVALWRNIAERHGGVRIEGKRYCSTCRADGWPCPDLRAVVAACRAYAGGQ